MKRIYTLLFALTLCCFSFNSFSQISFSATPENGCVPLTVSFTNTTADPNAVNFVLFFGDGNNSSNVDTNYTYLTPGDYYPYLNAYDASWNFIGSYNGNLVSVIGGTYISSSADSACPGDVINFSNYNSNAISWNWDFGDGNFSSAQYTSHTFSSAGSYTVTLTQGTSACGSFVSTKTINITNTIPASPIGFGHYPNPSCPNTSINHYPYTNATSYVWDFGDGFSDTVSNPYHTYTTPGTYGVTLTTTNGCGNSASYTDSAYIVSYLPFDSNAVIDISPDSACPNEYINMYAPYGGSAYVFDFGDGSLLDSSSSYYRSHFYSSLGNYTLTTKVYNNCGNDTTYSLTVPIVNTIGFPQGLSASNSSPVCPGNSISLQAPYNYAWYVWNYGDGSPIDSVDINYGPLRYHTYSSVGTYTASVTIYNACGLDTTLYTTVSITNTEPIPGYVTLTNNSPACPGSNINLDASYGFAAYVWDYGDGSPVDSIGNNYVYHNYVNVGTYTASVTIYNTCGNDTTLYTAVNISNTEPIPNYVGINNNSPACPGSYIGIYTNSGFASYVWNYGDGSPIDSVGPYGEYRSYAYSSVGTYTASVTIYNTCGNDTTLYTSVNVTNAEPVPNYVTLNNSSPGCPGSYINIYTNSGFASYVWDYGDGSPVDSLGINNEYRSHIYSSVGTYTASVTIYNFCGNDTTLYTTVNISNTEPVPGYVNVSNSSPVCPGNYVNLYTSYGFPTYVWDYGDGSPVDSLGTNGDYRNHFYTSVGTYTASVTIYNSCGNDTTLYTTVNISNTEPVPGYVNVSNSSPACPGSNISFSTSGGFASYVWDYGDGSPVDSLGANGDYRNHIYSSVGTYNASVTIYNSCGNDTTLYTTVNISNTEPVPGYVNVSNSSPACPGSNISFSTSGGFASYVWDYGDGSAIDSLGFNGDYRNHIYTSVGIYNASVTIYNYCGNDTTLYTTISITNNEPIPGYVSLSNNSPGCPGGSVQLNTDYGFWAYVWNYGDGSAQDSLDINNGGWYRYHTYSTVGIYTASVTIYNACGNDTTLYTTVDINTNSPFPTSVYFNHNPSEACPNDNINFNAESGFVSYKWDYGDGSPFQTTNNPYSNHNYISSGTYYTSLTITNACGNDTVLYDSVVISNYASFPSWVQVYTNNPSNCPGQQTSIYTNFGNGGSYEWDFGDGSPVQTTQYSNTYHTYTSTGTFTITLTITNNCGNDTTVTGVVQVEYPLFPAMSININTSPACPGQSVGFDVQNGFYKYIWDFGDGSPAYVSYSNGFTSHAYPDTGVYAVSVKILQNCGIDPYQYPNLYKDTTIYASVMISSDAGFTQSVSVNSYQGMCSDDINFSATDGFASYEWDYGDGETDTTSNGNASHSFANTGTYNITVKITNFCGSDTTLYQTINISEIGHGNFLPSCGMCIPGDTSSPYQVLNPIASYNNDPWNWYNGMVQSICPGENIYLNTIGGTIYPNGGGFDNQIWYVQDNVSSVVWNYGDGTSSDSMAVDQGQNGIYTSHTFNNIGVDTFSVTLYHKCGNDTTVYGTITVDTTLGFSNSFYLNGSQAPCVNENAYFAAYYQSGGYIGNNFALYQWDFGDGSPVDTTNSASASHLYSSTGTYTVSLTVTNYCGKDTTVIKTVTVVDYKPFDPGANLYSNQQSACPGENVWFWADVPGDIVSYEWNFGDSTPVVIDTLGDGPGTGGYLNHQFADTGTYTVAVTVTNRCGNDTTLIKTVSVVGYKSFPYWVNLNANPNPACPGDYVNFNASYGFASYIWDFGDGSPVDSSLSNYPNINHTYDSVGTYTAMVTITNFCGNDTTISKTVNINGNIEFGPYTPLGEPWYVYNYPYAACPGQNINFYAPEGLAYYTWDFGDGMVDSISNYKFINHNYDSAGTYTVALTMKNNCGSDTTLYANVVIDNNLGFSNLSMNINPTAACPGQDVQINGPYGYASYIFDFGDGSPADSSTQSYRKHSFPSAGIYNVGVTIYNYCGLDTTIYAPVNIDTNVAFTYAPYINAYPSNVCPGQEVNFYTESGHMSYLWNFDDGSQAQGTSGVQHSFDSVGTYGVDVTITNFCGSDTMVSVNVSVSDTISAFPNMVMDVSPSVSCPGDMVELSINGGFSSYFWTFGDGDTLTSLGNKVEHIYSASGNYNASVMITNGCGYTTTAYEAINVNSNAPVDTALSVHVPFNPNCPGDEVFFNIYNGANTYVYNWNFADGSADSTVGTGTSHVFADTGDYAVTLTATNGCGNTKTITVNTEIDNTVTPSMEPGETFGFGTGESSSTAGCPGDAVLFWFAGTADNEWNFGDGSTGVATEQVMTGMGVPITVIKHVYSAVGNYTASLTLTNNCGNSVTDSINLVIGGNLLVDGSIFIAPPTGTSGYTTCSSIDMIGTGGSNYSWDFGDGDTISTVSPTISHTYSNPGTYTVSVKVTNGCGYSATYYSAITVNGIGGPSATVAGTSSSCYGSSDGSATVTVNDGIAPFTYVWDVNAGSQTDSTATGLSAGTYSVSVVDNLGCSTVESVTVSQPTDMTIAATINNSTCGAADGSAIVTVSGGTGGPYTYNWSNGSTISFATGLYAGNYSITVTNGNGCSKVENISVNNGNAATVTLAASSNVSCNSGSDGSVDISVSGGTSPYSYLWSDSSTTEDLSGLNAGTYSVTVTDANNCVSGQSVTISQPNDLSLTTTVTNANCGSFNGNATVNVNGGTASYSYLWDDNTGNKTTATVTGLPAGQYEVIVTDANGCTDSITAVISNANAPVITAVVTNVSCNGAADGSVTQTVTGGTNPYLYNWSNGANTKNVSGLVPGSYTVIITDASNCVSIRNYTITQPDALVASLTSADASCGNADGSATITATGGTTSYSYLWSDGQTTSTATGLAAGDYSVTVTDSKGCTAADSITVTQPSTFASAAASDSVSCNGGNDGIASIAPAGGNSPYSYLWASSETTDTISGLSAGSYSVTITDTNGCLSENSVAVGEPDVLAVSFAVTDVLCFGNANGSADATVSGGTAPYSYLWSSGDSVATISGLSAGTYAVTITDANGCMLEDSAGVNEPAQLSASITGTDANCNNVCDGSATVTPSGGTSPYTYLWSNGDNTDVADSLCDGNFVVNISDANNCQATQNITIAEPDTLVVTILSVGTTCGNTDGSATASAVGGTTPYAYLWSDNQTDSAAVGLGTGNISVTVTDNNGCMASANDSIGTYVPPVDICIVTVDSTSTKNLVVWEKPSVNYIDSFRIYREIVGTYTYIGSVDYLDLSKFTDTTNGVNPNITSYKYTVSVVDNCGNESAMSGYHKTMHLQTIFQSGEVDLSWDNYDGFGTNFYYRILRDSTGVGNWQVLDSVSFGNTQYTDIAPPTGLINYMMEVVHPFGGCLATKAVENHNSSRSNRGQSANAAPLSANTSVTDATQGICDGTATVTAGGGIAPYTYLWNDSFNQTTETATGLCAGSYTVTVTDVNGDTITASVTVGVQPGVPGLSLEKAVKVYPNPNKGEFTVYVSALTINNIKIYNMLGEVVYQSSNIRSQLSIDLSERGSGIYYIQVSGEHGMVNKRIIIE